MRVSILVVDDGFDVAELFGQRFRRKTRSGTSVMQLAVGRGGSVAAPLTGHRDRFAARGASAMPSKFASR